MGYGGTMTFLLAPKIVGFWRRTIVNRLQPKLLRMVFGT